MTNNTEVDLAQARETLATARRSYSDAMGRITSQRAAIVEAEASLAGLADSAADSTENPEAGADWRRKRAGLLFEIEGLREQLTAMEKTMERRERTVQDAEVQLSRAECSYYDSKLLQIHPQISRALDTVLDGWALYCNRIGIPFSDDRQRLSDWLFGGNGLFDLEKLNNPARQKRTSIPETTS